MVTFRCKRSGNTVSFTDENDIESLRRHDGYEEVKDEKIETKEESNLGSGSTKEKEVLNVPKKRGPKPKK